MADEWTDPDPSYPLLVPSTSTNGTRGRRKSNFTQAEVSMLYAMMRKYSKHLRGRVSSTEDLVQRRKIWMKIVEAVNSVSVEERTLVEIKSKWKKCKYEDDIGR